ncbi:MAG: hypothetical protein HUU55_11045 [Myxococcales bacterium]|nr:hypothetical protein [Myxococcales bacterium]
MRTWKTLILGAFLAFGLGFGVTACEVEDSEGDATGTTDTTGGSDTTGGEDTGGGECPSPTLCGEDGFCNILCGENNGLPIDFDCNINTPANSDKADNKTSPNSCSCDYWGFVCEASEKCTSTPCDCDADCADVCTDATLIAPCGADDHCDTWCPTGVDPDCAGDPEDGKYCN